MSGVSLENSSSLDEPDVPVGTEDNVLTHPNLRILSPNDQIRELQTIIRDRSGWNFSYSNNYDWIFHYET